MAKDSSVWRGNWGRLSITALIIAAVALAIWKQGDVIGLNSNGLKLPGFVVAMILLLLIRHGKTIGLAIKQHRSRLQAKREKCCQAMKIALSRWHHAISLSPLRTEAGEEPLALLKLRNFTLPDSIFSVRTTPQYADDNAGITDAADSIGGTD